MNNYELDQGKAEVEYTVTELIAEWRRSLDRKRERHGENFDEGKAIEDLFVRLLGMDSAPKSAVLAAAINRLAKMPDYNPVPSEIAELDFDFEVDEEES
jgi:hypothetical protein